MSDELPERIWLSLRNAPNYASKDDPNDTVEYVRADFMAAAIDEGCAERAAEHYNAGWNTRADLATPPAPQSSAGEIASKLIQAARDESTVEDAVREMCAVCDLEGLTLPVE